MIDWLAPGQQIAERYRLERLLGEGGMGQVWAATHLITRKGVALKFLKASGKNRETMVRRFMREARAVSAVNHPNVVAVHDLLELADGTPVMVMDLLRGTSLAARLAQLKKIELGELATILVPVFSAVGTAHAAGIVHRDLKPDNIMLHVGPDGRIEPKVLDFGIAKLSATEGEAAATAHLTNTGAVLGTPYYMAPEQVFGEKDIDQRADVWAMGVIIYECLSGQRPVQGENFGQLFKAIATGRITPLASVAPHVPLDVTDLVGRMIERDRAKRCPDLREAYALLSRYGSAQALSFGGATAPAADLVSTGGSGKHVVTPAGADPNLAFEATSAADGQPGDGQVSGRRPSAGLPDGQVSGRRPSAGLPDVLAQTPPALAHSRADVVVRRPRRAALIAALLAVVTPAAVWLAARARPTDDPIASASGLPPGLPEASPATASVAALVPPPDTPTALASDAAPLPASASAAPLASFRPGRPPKNGGDKRGERDKPPSSGASATAVGTVEPKPPEKLPGSVVEGLPF